MLIRLIITPVNVRMATLAMIVKLKSTNVSRLLAFVVSLQYCVLKIIQKYS